MSLDKAIANGKEHRKKYTGGKSVAKSCRNHGGCEWCLGNRMYKYDKKKFVLDEELKGFDENGNWKTNYFEN